MEFSRRWKPYAAGALAVALWGATPAATAIVARDLPSGLIGIARLLASAAVLAPVMVAIRPRLPADAASWMTLAVSSLVGFAASFVFQGLGIARTSTAHAALILTLAPVATALVQFVLSKAWPSRLWWSGSAIAMTGVVLLIAGRTFPGAGTEPTLFGDALVFAGTLTVSVGYVAGARLSSQIGMFGATSWSIVLGAIIALPLVPALATSIPTLGAQAILSLVFLAAGCTLVGYAAWFWALGNGGVASIALLQFAQPVVSLIIAATLLGEDVSAKLVFALILMLAGTYLCRKGR